MMEIIFMAKTPVLVVRARSVLADTSKVIHLKLMFQMVRSSGSVSLCRRPNFSGCFLFIRAKHHRNFKARRMCRIMTANSAI